MMLLPKKEWMKFLLMVMLGAILAHVFVFNRFNCYILGPDMVGIYLVELANLLVLQLLLSVDASYFAINQSLSSKNYVERKIIKYHMPLLKYIILGKLSLLKIKSLIFLMLSSYILMELEQLLIMLLTLVLT